MFDLLFTDYLGMYGVHQVDLVASYKCRIRVLDSFGTEPKCMLPPGHHTHTERETLFSPYRTVSELKAFKWTIKILPFHHGDLR